MKWYVKFLKITSRDKSFNVLSQKILVILIIHKYRPNYDNNHGTVISHVNVL